MKIDQVWFASPERSRDIWKFAAEDDTGALELTPGHIRYIGGELPDLDIAVKDVLSIRKGIQGFPWGTLAAFAIPFLLLSAVTLASGAAPDRIGSTLGTTALALAGVYIVNLNWPWVVVTWRDPIVGTQRTAYFADGSARGWGGRTSLIHAVLTGHLHGKLGFPGQAEAESNATL